MANNPVEWAIKNGDMGALRSAISEDKTLACKPFDSGRHPLVVAADYGQQDVIEFLISNGCDVNVSDKYGITPLLAAIYEGHTECIKHLLKMGADKEKQTPDGQSYSAAAESDSIKALLQ